MSNEIVSSFTAASLREVLLQKGYRAEIVADAAGVPQIRSATNGLSFILRFGNRLGGAADAYLDAVLTTALQGLGAATAAAIDQWNASKRFARLHRSGELLFLEMDLSVIGGVTRSHLDAQIEIWDRMVQELINYVRTVLAPAAARDSQSAAFAGGGALTTPQRADSPALSGV